MSIINNGGPAFPVPGFPNDEAFNGMTLRDYFAAKAMQGMILLQSYRGTAADMAKESYSMADAMLKAREAK